MRVLMVFGGLFTGGAETTALRLARALIGSGAELTVAAVRAGGPLGGAFADAGARVYDGLAACRFDPRGMFRIARIIRRHDVDAVIVVSVTRNGMFHGLLGAALSGRKPARLCWCNSVPGGQSGHFLGQLRMYRKLGLLHAVICTSRLQQGILADGKLPRRRLPLIHNGVDLSAADAPDTDLALPEGKWIVTQVANVMPAKDFDTLIEAARLLAERRDDVHLVLVGRDTDSSALAGAVNQAGLDGVVTLAGRRDDVAGILSASDVLVLSTHKEVFSVATLEGMAAGLPVVVSDIAAFDEMFEHGREGLKVAPGNPAALADAVTDVLDDADLRRRLGEASRRRADHFSTDRMAAKFLRLLPAAVRRARGG